MRQTTRKPNQCMIHFGALHRLMKKIDENFSYPSTNNKNDDRRNNLQPEQGNPFLSFIDQCWPFIEQAHFFKLSDEEAILITGCDTVHDAAASLRKKSKAVFAITMGKEGTLLSMGDHLKMIGSIAITPVDATGAGDAFVGSFYAFAIWIGLGVFKSKIGYRSLQANRFQTQQQHWFASWRCQY